MTKKQAQARIEKLKKVISHHRYLYHVLDRQEISDEVHDSLKRELSELERQFPDLITPDSPTQRVGGEPLDKFEKVQHTAPMLSIDDVFTQKDVQDWESYLSRLVPNERTCYFCEVKIDGFAISLLYKNGLLVRAATRGNGRVGEDVTGNIRTVESVPLRLVMHERTLALKILKRVEAVIQKGEIEIRGEIYMDKKTFKKINREQSRAGQKPYSNPRNLAAGSVRQLDPVLTQSRNLKFFAYDIIGDVGQTKHSEEHQVARALGFRTVSREKICKNTQEILDFWGKVTKERDKLPYNIDGVVVTIDDNALFDKLGVAGKSPRGIRAFKFAPKQTTTVVQDIQVHVGRTGAVTPIAHLRPVQISGVTVSRATLHNQDEIDRLDVRIGDTVIVARAGDVIPDVIEAVKNLRTGKEKKFHMPIQCPQCRTTLRKTEEVILRCTNKDCPARNREHLYFFASGRAFDIEGLGPKIIDQLLESGLISNPADIFDLKEGDLVPLERFQEKSARNIISAIDKSKNITLARFIHALGIRHVGEETAADLAEFFGSIENLEKASKDDIRSIPDIGGVVAKEVYDWFGNRHNKNFIQTLVAKGVSIEKPEHVGTKLKGKTFVFTGAFEKITRQEAERKVRMLGGNPAGSVSSQTDYVVVGENPGSKYDQARELGVKIIDEKKFLKML